jgi:uncharacterized protein with HEPN domain
MKRSINETIKKLIKYCDEIISFVNGFDYDGFISDLKTFRAITLCLLQMGKLVCNMDKSFKDNITDIDWNGIAGLRHRLVHDYEGINDVLIWNIASSEISKLKNDLEKLKV